MSSSSVVPLVKLSSGASIPQLGLGVFLTEASAAATAVFTALEAGYRHIDSAAFYRNEAEVGEGIAKFLKAHPEVSRSDIFYTTKVWEADHGYEKTKAAIKENLAQVPQLEYIDLLLIHSPNAPSPETRLGTWKAMQEAVEEGKVKSIGVSNYNIKHIQELLNWDGLKIKPAVDQVEIHPWLQRVELVKFLKDNGIAVEAYSPLTRGRKLDDPQLVKMAEKYGKTPAQVLIRWSLQKGFISIPKSVQKPRIEENFNVFDFELSKEDVEGLGDPTAYVVTAWDPTGAP